MVIFTTIAKLIPLLLVVLFGLGKISVENLAWKGSFGMAEIGAGTLVFFYAFLGIETSVSNSGEFKNPARVVPLGILSGLSLVLMIYLLIQLVTQGILGDELQMHKDAPLAEVSNRLFGALGIVLVTIGAAVAMLGNLSGEIFSIPRIFFAGARDGIFPKFFGKVHPRFVTPARAIILYSSIDFIFALFGGLRQLLILSTATTLLIYLGVVLAVIRLRRIMPMASGTGFRVPGGMVVPVITSIAILWLFFTLTWPELAGMALLLGLLSLVYFFMRYRLQR
jgi:amino acid transporter